MYSVYHLISGAPGASFPTKLLRTRASPLLVLRLPSITPAYCLRYLPAIYRLGSSLFICHAKRAARLRCENKVSVINGIKASGSRSEEQLPGTSLLAETVSMPQIAVVRLC